jgi:iron complex outermembrane receptor protein
MRTSTGRSWLIALLLCFIPLAAAAQGGTITGTLTQAATGAPLVGAKVSAEAPGGTSAAATVSGERGEFRLSVAPGRYTLVVAGDGFETRRIAVQVGAARPSVVNARITAGAALLDPVVVTASRRAEKALNAPARVEVVSEREIEDRPAVTAMEHLRSVPGIDIATTGVQSSNVVARGFNNIFSGSLHMLTDNRIAGVPSLRVNLMHFVPSTNEDLERIEVVLGPGSALYGPNTADGILHMITKSPLTSQENVFSMAGGERGLLHATGRVSRRVGDNFGVKLSGQYLRAEEWAYTDRGEAIERDKFAADATGFYRRDLMRAVGIDSAEAVRRIGRIGSRDQDVERWGGEARADWRIAGGPTTVFAAGTSHAARGVELTGLGASQVRDWRLTYYQARANWGRAFGQVYLNTSDAGDTYLLRNGAPIVDRSKLLVAQLQHGASIRGVQRFTYGVDYIRTMPETEGTINGAYEDEDGTTELGGYLQSETALSPRLDLVLAGRVDGHSALPDPVFSPRAGLVFKPAENHAVRATFNRAFATPSSLNQFLDLGSSIPNASLAQLGYSLRVQGTGENGFSFRTADGGYQMRSPFTPAALGGPAQLLPADATRMWAGAVAVVAQQAAGRGQPLSPQLVQYLAGLRPTGAQIGTMFLDVTQATPTPQPLSALALDQVDPIRESTSTTMEVGYKGIVRQRLLLAADVWRTRREGFVTPLTIQTPLLTLNGQQTAAYLVPRLMADLGMSQAQAVATATQLATGLAAVPVGAVSSADVNANGPQLLVTYQNVDEALSFWGTDLSATALLSRRWSLGVTGSYVSDDRFQTESAGLVTLNAPKWKGSMTASYRNDDRGLTGEARVRHTAGFPVNSGVYVGTRCLAESTNPLLEDCVSAFTLADVSLGYRIPRARGVSVQLNVQNLLDEDYRSFPGAPSIGRMALVRMRWEF